MAIAQDRFHDLRGEKAEPDDAGEVRAPDTGLPGEVEHRAALGFEHHLPIAMRLGEEPQHAAVRRPPRPARPRR